MTRSLARRLPFLAPGASAGARRRPGGPPGSPAAPARPPRRAPPTRRGAPSAAVADVAPAGAAPASTACASRAPSTCAPASPSTAARLREGLRTLWALGMFEDLRVGRGPGAGGCDLCSHVPSARASPASSFQGNKKRSDERLEPHLACAPATGSPRRSWPPSTRCCRIYREEGYARAEVTATTRQHRSPAGGGRASSHRGRREGADHRGRVPRAATRSPDDLLRKLKSKKKGCFAQRQAQGRDRRGRRAAHTLLPRPRLPRRRGAARARSLLDPTAQGMTLVYSIDEGPRVSHRQGGVGRATASLGDAQVLRRSPAATPAQMYDAAAIRKAVEERLLGSTPSTASSTCQVEPPRRSRDSDRVDITFQVTEGPPRTCAASTSRATRAPGRT